MIKLGSIEPSNYKIGSTQVQKIYLGSTLIWEYITTWVLHPFYGNASDYTVDSVTANTTTVKIKPDNGTAPNYNEVSTTSDNTITLTMVLKAGTTKPSTTITWSIGQWLVSDGTYKYSINKISSTTSSNWLLAADGYYKITYSYEVDKTWYDAHGKNIYISAS